MTDPIKAGAIKAETIYGFEFTRSALGLPPLTGDARDAEIARVTAEAEAKRRAKREKALAGERMTVGKLIEALSAYPNDMPVMTPGSYEVGLDDIALRGTSGVVLGADFALAEHGEAKDGEKPDLIALILDH